MVIRFKVLILLLFFNSLLAAQSVSDYDGNVYPILTIGSQQWTGTNLRTTHFSDGTPLINAGISNWYFAPPHLPRFAMPLLIPGSTDSISLGMWYNYPAAGSALNLCPDGWRVATDADWAQLILFIDSNASDSGTLESSIAGGLLKDTLLWAAPNTGAVNAFGFSILPVSDIGGSIIPPAGHVCCSSLNAAFWCANGPWTPGTICYDRRVSWADASVIHNTDNYTNGKSVRCVRALPSSMRAKLPPETELTLSPNPSNGVIVLSVDRHAIGTILIYNPLGSLLRQLSAPGSSLQIDLSDLSKGLYFLSFPDHGQSKKLILD